MSRGIQSLVNHIGDENIKVQILSQCTDKVVFQKKQTKVTFVTEPNMLNSHDVTSGRSEYAGFIIWVKTDDLEEWQRNPSNT